jgi:hypothetical protein
MPNPENTKPTYRSGGSIKVVNNPKKNGVYQGFKIVREPAKKAFGSTSKAPTQLRSTPKSARNGAIGRVSETTTGGKEVKKFGSTSTAPTHMRRASKSTTDAKGTTTKITKSVVTNTAGKSKKQAVKAAAERRSTREHQDYMDKVVRPKRIAEGKFKGKYYGPDEFKGDLKKLRAWREAGSPKDKSKFAKD